jgi:hypothetical protein
MKQRYYSKDHAGYYREGSLVHGSMSSKVELFGKAAMSQVHSRAESCGTVNAMYEFHNYIGIIETRRRIWLN